MSPSVPDLLRLWSEGRKNPLGKQVWKLGICGSMLHDPDDLTMKADRAAQEGAGAGDGLQRGAGGRVRQGPALPLRRGAVFDYRFTGRQLSTWDWFHPGTRGQQELASLAFRAITREERP